MIILSIQEDAFAKRLLDAIEERGVKAERLSPNASDLLERLYQPNVSAAVVETPLSGLPAGASADVLNALGRRIPVILLPREPLPTGNRTRSQVEYSDSVTVLREATFEAVVSTLSASGVLNTEARTVTENTVAYYNPHIPTKMLMTNGGLAFLTIDASSFRKIEIEYGYEVYLRVKNVFQKMLVEHKGKKGCFRNEDVLCRRSEQGNVYLVFLSKSRTTGSLPLPGVLENIADRVSRVIQNALWTEATKTGKERRLPHCIRSIPSVSVGFSGIVHNPCLNPAELISSAIDGSAGIAKIQMVRLKNRQKEMMQTLIQSDSLLYPHYQAIFRLPEVTAEEAEASRNSGSIAPLVKHLFGFESLIRVRAGEVQDLMGESCPILDSRFMRPDVLFALAKEAKVALELDQACLNHAINHSGGLPGYLMVNILPRNLHFVDYLKRVLRKRPRVVLEISESEAINNLALINEVRAEIEANDIRIAADDFGKAFTGLDRVIKIQPHYIKFDRSLIQNIHADSVRRAYVTGLVRAARLLNTAVLAEGVELWEEAECLKKMGIDFIQGFLLHKPQPVDQIHAQLATPAAEPARVKSRKKVA